MYAKIIRFYDILRKKYLYRKCDKLKTSESPAILYQEQGRLRPTFEEIYRIIVVGMRDMIMI